MKVDGIIGNDTLRAAQSVNDIDALIGRICSLDSIADLKRAVERR